MNITAAAAGSPLPLQPLPQALNTLPDLTATRQAAHSVALHDSVSASLGQMLSPPLQHLLQVVEDRLAVLQHSAPAQATNDSIAPDARAVADAKDVAEGYLAKAVHAIGMAGEHSPRIPADLDPQTVLALASRFIDTGQIPNYQRAAELGREVLSWYDDELPVVSARELQLRSRFRDVRLKLWRRAPLLVLLAGWLVAGIVADLVLRTLNVPAYETGWTFDLWAMGFLGLVVFQFAVVTIRGARK